MRVSATPPRVAIAFLFTVLSAAPDVSSQAGGPPPYAPIASPLPDTLDQLLRDSLNMRISPLRVNQAGWRAADRKFFYRVGGGGAFSVLGATGSVAGTGTLSATGRTASGKISVRAANNAQRITGGDLRYTMASPEVAGPVFEGELPSLPPGSYRVAAGGDTSAPFLVDDNVYAWLRDALLRFYGVNRSGEGGTWFHPPSHLKDGPGGDGSLSGGWYDCGDHLKEAQTMSYALAMLGLAAAAMPAQDADHYGPDQAGSWKTDGIPDILYEAKHGADFVLKSFALAKGDPAEMVTSVGNFGEDHGWWGQPQYQDGMPKARGGPVRELRKETGANVMGRNAAGLAFVARAFAPYDKAYADKCLAAAKAMYAFGKANPKASSSSAYSGESSIYDDMGLAAVALLWATRDTAYKYDLIANTAIGNKGNAAFPAGTFAGGWFAYDNPSPQHGLANTSWASVETPALWAFYRLVLKDETGAAAFGIDAAQRLDLIEDVVFALIANVGDLPGGAGSIPLPAGSIAWKNSALTYDPLWKINTYALQEWVYNRYIAGNSTEFFCYYDIAKDIQGLALPHTPASTDWKAKEVKELLVRQMDYFLGVNPWDLSLIYGVGSKAFNHPHHRGANPEGKNVPGAFYRYRPPVGALQGGQAPDKGAYAEHFDDYRHSEVCLDGTTSLLLPVMGLAKDEDVSQLPAITVRIEYVGPDRAIIVVKQGRYGTSLIRYGLSADALNQSKAGDSAGVEHRIVLTELKPGTAYWFQAEAQDLRGNKGINDNGGSKFTFTTPAQKTAPAQIAQVKVCNVTHDSAEILWYTPNGAYDSKVVYGTAKPPATVQDGDFAGHPVKLHYVKIGGLREKTQYWFYVESNGSKDDNGGAYYSFNTRVEHVEFDIRAVKYEFGGIPFLGLNVINQDTKAYDSLDLRVYLRGTEAEMKDFAAAVDIGIQYDEAGFQGTHFKAVLDPIVQAQKPVKLPDTYDVATGNYYWYLSLPMGPILMKPGSRFRLDIAFRKRNLPFDDNLLYMPSSHIPGMLDWSWGAHSRSNGEPADYKGIKAGGKDDLDTDYWNHEKNAFITVYRKGQFIYGFSPSAKEQATRVSHYVMDARITAPLNHPPEDFKILSQPSSTARVKGTVTITDAGQLTDIWVNGEKVPLTQAAVYDKAADVWNLDIPVVLKPGPNEVDITLFGGPAPACAVAGGACVGCVFKDLHFHLDWRKADAFPSSLVLLDPATSQALTTLAVPGSTRFLVSVTDKNGDRNAFADSLRVSITNPNSGDAMTALLIETGPRTGVFRAVDAVAAGGGPTGPGRIAMAEGDSVWVVYRDPSDADDSSRAFLYTPATFPQALSGWVLDTDADGAIDKAVVLFSKPLSGPPDSLRLPFPDSASGRMVSGTFAVAGNRLEANLSPPFAPGTTGFTGARTPGRAWLTAEGRTRVSAFALADSAGPVLNSAWLRPAGDAAAQDTLTVTFSEPMAGTNLSHPFEAWQAGRAHAAGDLKVARVLSAQGAAWIVLLDPSSPLRLEPGDSLRLAFGQAGAIADPVGNFPGTGNRRVVVEGSPRTPPAVLSLAWDLRGLAGPGSDAKRPPFTLLARDGSGNWSPFQGSDGRRSRPCASLDCGPTIPAATDGGLPFPSLVVSADRPFRYEAALFSNLGILVARCAGEVGPDLLETTGGAAAPVHADAATGRYEVRLAWNGRTSEGSPAGTGAYVWKARASLARPAAAGLPPLSVESSRTIGFLRGN